MDSDLGQKMMCRLISLVRKHIEGIDMMDISRDYYKNYGSYLVPNDFDFKSMFDLCEKVVQMCGKSLLIVERNTRHIKFDRIFFDFKLYQKWIKENQLKQNIPLLELLVFTHYSLPNDVLSQTSSALPSLELPDNAFDLNYIRFIPGFEMKAKLTHVETPNQIYIHLASNKQKYRELREGLRYYDAYYGDSDEEYIFPEELLINGYYCVIRNPLDEYNWHRGVITGHDENIVSVFAIDFGNTIVDNVSELRLMKSQFFTHSPLAIKVSLAGIEPLDSLQWTEASITYIKCFIAKYCVEYTMGVAFLYKLDADYYEVVLGYPKEKVTERLIVYLHEQMIHRKLANMAKVETDFITFLSPECLTEMKTNQYFPQQKNTQIISEPKIYLNEEMLTQYYSNSRKYSPQKLIQIYSESEKYLSEDIKPDINSNLRKYFCEDIKTDINSNQRKYFSEDIKTDINSNERKYFSEDIKTDINSIPRKYISANIKTDINLIPRKDLSEDIKTDINSNERKYFSEDMMTDFNSNQRKYFSEDIKTDINSNERKYFSEDMMTDFNSNPRKYFSEKMKSDYNSQKRKYFIQKLLTEYQPRKDFNQELLTDLKSRKYCAQELLTELKPRTYFSSKFVKELESKRYLNLEMSTQFKTDKVFKPSFVGHQNI